MNRSHINRNKAGYNLGCDDNKDTIYLSLFPVAMFYRSKGYDNADSFLLSNARLSLGIKPDKVDGSDKNLFSEDNLKKILKKANLPVSLLEELIQKDKD